MMRRYPFRILPIGHRTAGVALILVLAFIVVITMLLLGFVSKSRSGATASTNFASSTAADMLATDAVNTVLGTLHAEIEAGSHTEGDLLTIDCVYSPNGDSDVLPKLDDDTISAAEKLVPNLLRSSNSSALASGVLTSQASLNGRVVPRERWNSPRLLTLDQNSKSLKEGKDAPPWVYVDRKGSVRLGEWSDKLGRSLNNGDLNLDFVIGRYAYRVYDLSGLLDFNVAGFPASLKGNPRVSRKGSLAWLDLFNSSLPGFTPTAGSPSLFDWRGPAEIYESYADRFGLRYGFLIAPPKSYSDPVSTGTVSFGDANRFLTRNDLIEFTNASSLAAQFPDELQFLSQATMFSREVNAPSWRPETVDPSGVNPSAFSVRVVRPFTRRDGAMAKVGEPLVKSRFPLPKIDQFRIYRDPAGSAAQRNKAAEIIRTWFGLRPVTPEDVEYDADLGLRWKYLGRTENDASFIGGARERFRTFQEIANEGREPNYFEYLQAAISSESLGQAAKNNYLATSWTDQNIARQIFKIGVNIIDQYDTGSDPTVIARTPLKLISQYNGTPDPDIAGVKNIPYIQVLGRHMFRRFDKTVKGASGNINYPYLTGFYQFQLWNPHRNAAAASDGEFRIVAHGNLRLAISKVDGGTSANRIYANPLSYDPASTWITFTLKDDPTGKKFSEPYLLKPGSPSLSTSNLAPQNVYAGGNIVGFWQGDLYAPYDGFTATGASTPLDQRSHLQRFGQTGGFEAVAFVEFPDDGMTKGVTFQLQKKDASGQWLPVQTLPSAVEEPEASMIDVLNKSGTDNSNKTHAVAASNVVYIDKHSALADPRTIHFGMLRVGGASSTGVIDKLFPDTKTYYFNGWADDGGGGASPAYLGKTSLFQLGQLYANRGAASTYYFERRQNFTRLGDISGISPYTNAAGRPIFLNRPFTTVAEMGYASRDLPWKSLNLSQDRETTGANSADAALLDFFSMTEAPVRAGVLNLNNASEEVLTALLSGVNLSPMSGAEAFLSDSEAKAIAKAMRNYLGGRDNRKNVIRTAADLSRMIQVLPSASTWTKIKREAITAALADVHNARTWNLLIDVIAQTGRFPLGNSGGLDRFQMTAQKHLMMQVAIDRYTGKIIDKSIETPLENNR